MGKSTISTGPFSIAFCMFTRVYRKKKRYLMVKTCKNHGFRLRFSLKPWFPVDFPNKTNPVTEKKPIRSRNDPVPYGPEGSPTGAAAKHFGHLPG